MADNAKSDTGDNPNTPNTPGSTNTLPLTLRKAIDSEYAGSDPYHRGRRDAIRELYESGGLPQSQLGLEILFLLPDPFVKFYSSLFHQALTGGDSRAVSGTGGGIEKSRGKRNGIVLGSESGLQAQGTGKRYKNPTNMVGSLAALRTKETLDKELAELVRLGTNALRRYRSKADSMGQPSTEGHGAADSVRCHGKYLGRNGHMRGCGRFVRQGWNFCPTCGTRVEQSG